MFVLSNRWVLSNNFGASKCCWFVGIPVRRRTHWQYVAPLSSSNGSLVKAVSQFPRLRIFQSYSSRIILRFVCLAGPSFGSWQTSCGVWLQAGAILSSNNKFGLCGQSGSHWVKFFCTEISSTTAKQNNCVVKICQEVHVYQWHQLIEVPSLLSLVSYQAYEGHFYWFDNLGNTWNLVRANIWYCLVLIHLAAVFGIVFVDVQRQLDHWLLYQPNKAYPSSHCQLRVEKFRGQQ